MANEIGIAVDFDGLRNELLRQFALERLRKAVSEFQARLSAQGRELELAKAGRPLDSVVMSNADYNNLIVRLEILERERADARAEVTRLQGLKAVTPPVDGNGG